MGTIKREAGKDLQVCLFSATIPRWVQTVAREFMGSDVKMVDLAKDLKNKTAQTVNPLAINCPFHNRMSAMADILICYGGNGQTIVFT